jgi:diguanylate cyclase (GGDEF)-like protein
MFAAVDARDAGRTLEIDEHQVDPLFAAIERRVQVAARTHRSKALQTLGSLRASERFAVVVTPIAFIFGLALLGFLTLQLSRMYRRLRREAVRSEHNSLHDALTGLPNRALFADRLEHQIRAARRDPAPFSMLMIDLDRFKEINDTLGHAAGDRVLGDIGPRMQGILRPGDTIARLGGDEFAVLLPWAGRDDGDHAAERIAGALHEPFLVGDLTVTVDASIGVVTFPSDGEDAETLTRHADVAMYLAKSRGRGGAHYDRAADPRSPAAALVPVR